MSDHTHTYDDWQVDTYENQPKEQPMDKLDFSKPETLQRRDGGEFRILATDVPGTRPIAVACKYIGHDVWFTHLTKDGRLLPDKESPYDIIPKPVRVTGWCAVWKNMHGDNLISHVAETPEKAKAYCSGECFGVIYIDAEVQQ